MTDYQAIVWHRFKNSRYPSPLLPRKRKIKSGMRLTIVKPGNRSYEEKENGLHQR